MSAKKATKREFDWRAYTKPPRLLTERQEDAIGSGVLRPLLDSALSDRDLSLQIRAKQAALYHRGLALARVTEAPDALAAQIDANLRLARAQRPNAERLETWPLATPDDAAGLLRELAEMGARLKGWAATEPAAHREWLARFSEANSHGAYADAEILVADIEYQYGKRRFDFVGMRRAAGVGGFGAFCTPRLVIGHLFEGERSASAISALESFGADAAEFAHALSGEHLMRAKAELGELIAQKTRLGLLPAELPFSHFTADAPEIIAVFASQDFWDSSLDAPIAALHDRAIARHYSAELLSLAAIGDARGSGDPTMALLESDILPYRAFKGMRKRLQAQAAEASSDA